MLFKGNSLKLEKVIVKIHEGKETSTEDSFSTELSSWRSDSAEENSLSSELCNTPNSSSETSIELSTAVSNETSSYVCQFCDKSYPKLSFLKKHEQTHCDQMPFKCDYCQRLFKHKRSRDRHVKLHTGDKKYRCPHCEAAFSRSDHLKIHLKTHDTQKPYQCKVCNRGYNTAAALTSHVQNHKKEHVKKFRCLGCATVLETKEELQAHNSAHHGAKQIKLSISERELNEELPLSKDVADATCVYCLKECSSLNDLQEHIETFHKNYCSEKLTYPYMKMESFQHPPQVSPQFLCDFCGVTFASVHSLQKHTLGVHSHSPIYNKLKDAVICSYCSVILPSLSVLAEHLRFCHASIQFPFFDPAANYPFLHKNSCTENYCYDNAERTKNSADLRKRASSYCISASEQPREKKKSFRSSAFSEIKPSSVSANGFLCSRCNAYCADLESFRRHLKIHMEQASNFFPCLECNNNFDSREELEAHCLTHFLSVEKIYDCRNCNRIFIKPDELQKHLMDMHAHHLYQCSFCKEIFDSKVSMQVHFAVKHSKECCILRCIYCSITFLSEMEFQIHVQSVHLKTSFPYRCIFCCQSYSSEADLHAHLPLHQKQITCNICNEGFYNEFLLDKHMSSMHGAGLQCQSVYNGNVPDILPRNNSKSSQESSPSSKSAEYDANTKSANSKSCQEKGKCQGPENHKKPKQLSPSAGYKCNICDENFLELSFLAEHKVLHCRTANLTCCNVCAENLLLEEDFFLHVKKHCCDSFPVTCVICRHTLSSDVEIQLHAKFHIKFRESIQCCCCLKSSNSSDLIVNGLKNGIQTYVCRSCFRKQNEQQSAESAKLPLLTDADESSCSTSNLKTNTTEDITARNEERYHT